MKIGQALKETWLSETQPLLEYLAECDDKTKYPNPRTPLMYYLEYNYKERYVALCKRCGIQPKSFGAWLRTDI